MPKSSRKSIQVVRDKKKTSRVLCWSHIVPKYSLKTSDLVPADSRKLNTEIIINLTENMVGALTTIPPEKIASHYQKVSKDRKLILNKLNTSFTKSYCVKNKEHVVLLVITNGNANSSNIKHNVKN